MQQHQYTICRELFHLPGNAKLVEVAQHGLALVVLDHVALQTHAPRFSTHTDAHTSRRKTERTYHFERHARVDLVHRDRELVLNALHLRVPKTIGCERAVSRASAHKSTGGAR